MGRHPKYRTAEEMQSVIDKYFADCAGHPMVDDEGQAILDKHGNVVIVDTRPPTVTGLALALGFTSRQALLNYQGKAKFVDTVLRAKLRVEAYTEERLFDRDGQRGAEFSLTYNFRWRDEDRDSGEADQGGVVLLPPVMENPGPPAGGVDNG